MRACDKESLTGIESRAIYSSCQKYVAIDANETLLHSNKTVIPAKAGHVVKHQRYPDIW